MQDCINLLPARAINRFRRRRSVAKWVKAVAFAALLSVLSVVVGQNNAMHTLKKITKSEGLASRPRAIQQANLDLRLQLQQLKLLDKRHRELRSRYSPLAVLSALSKTKKYVDGAVEVETIEFAESTPAKNKADANKVENGYVVINMKTNSVANSAKIVETMRNEGLFRDVKLQNSLEQQTTGDGDLRFSIRGAF